MLSFLKKVSFIVNTTKSSANKDDKEVEAIAPLTPKPA